MALHMERLAAPAGGMGAQRAYMPHSSTALAAPRHPGKYVLESLLESSDDEDEDDQSQQSQPLQQQHQQKQHELGQQGHNGLGQGGWGPSPAEAAATPFSLQPARYPGSANHHITHLPHTGHLVPAPVGDSDHTSLDSGSGGEAQVQLKQEDPQPLKRLERIREAPYPHRWPSHKRRKCRSLGYLAVHAPTLTEEEVVVRPSSVAALPLLAPAIGSASAAPVHDTPIAVPPANGVLDASLGARAFFSQVQVPRPAALAGAKRDRQDGYQEPQRQTQRQPQPQQQSLQQRAAAAPPGKPPPPPAAAVPAPQRIAGAPRALQKPLQMASVAGGTAVGAGGSKAGQLQRGGSGVQPSAKRTRTAGPAGAAAATGAGGGAATGGRQTGKAAAGSKPPGKPAYKPSPSPQAPVRRPSSVTLDRQRSRSMPTPAQGGSGVPAVARVAAGPGGAAARPVSAAAAAAAGPRPSFQGAVPEGGDFPAGHVVWAKLPSYPWWPAQVQAPLPNHLAIRHGASDLFVVFYGTADVSWVPRKDLKHFSPALLDYTKHAGVRNKGLQRAIDEAWVALGRPRPDVNGKPHDG